MADLSAITTIDRLDYNFVVREWGLLWGVIPKT